MSALDPATREALDWDAVRRALSERARTPRGRQLAARAPLLDDPDAVSRALDETEDVLRLEVDGRAVPVAGIEDVREALKRAARGGVLDVDTLRGVGGTLSAVDGLQRWLADADAEHGLTALGVQVPRLALDRAVVDLLGEAFDETGQLSGRRWPELGELRQRLDSLHATIRRTLDELVRGDTLGDALQDRYVTQRGDRYVLPVKANYNKREIGIVHDVSGSGQTAFVEPHEVVTLNNALRRAEGALDAAERRILAMLSDRVGRLAPEALDALEAAAIVDLAVARAGLAVHLDAVRPRLARRPVVDLRAARHPVLVLRGLDVVANDLVLTEEAPILLVSGPNTGGKTVALKTLGLCALLVRVGCFIPADEGSTIGLFPHVRALVGDHQTVHEDHSSFSSHLLALHGMTEEAGPGSLLLVDEIASGTDPQQGAALAHALLERWLAAGARALVTTHFQRLKTLPATDPRFAGAGMAFAEGRPTYQLVPGIQGDSHALSVAERLGFGADLLARARALMDEEARTLAEALEALDGARADADRARREADDARRALAERERAVDRREAELQGRAHDLATARAEEFLSRVTAAEKAIAAVVADLQRQPSHAGVAAARASVQALAGIAPARPAPSEAPPRALAVGDRVRLKATRASGEVVHADGGRLQVRTEKGLTLRVKAKDVERLAPSAPARPRASRPAPPPRATPEPPPLEAAMRHEGNTVDLRGLRVDEGLEAVEHHIAEALASDQRIVFVLHGHGTGAMKRAVRQWLPTSPYVSSWRPAHVEQGGDAYTVAALR